MVSQKDVQDLFKKTNLMTISTLAKDGHPQTAVVEFASTAELEVIFDLDINSRKYSNLKRDPRAALVIGWDDNITVQYEGVAKEINDSELQHYKDIYFAKNADAKRWETEPNITYFKVSPRWLRYTNLNHQPWMIKEFTF